MWSLATVITVSLISAAAAAGFVFSGWFNLFRIAVVSVTSILLTIGLAVALMLGLHEVLILSLVTLQLISLIFLVSTGMGKLRHKLKNSSHAA